MSGFSFLTIYDATWANIRSASSYANVYTYTGRQLDTETGLYYYRARMLHAELGRFCSRDPIGYSPGESNVYGYCEQNAVTFQDPDGKQRAPHAAYQQTADGDKQYDATITGCTAEQVKQIKAALDNLYQQITEKKCLEGTGLDKCFQDLFAGTPIYIFCAGYDEGECVKRRVGGYWDPTPAYPEPEPCNCYGKGVMRDRSPDRPNLPAKIYICPRKNGKIPREGYTLEEILMHELMHQCGLHHSEPGDDWQSKMFKGCVKKCYPEHKGYRDADPKDCKCPTKDQGKGK